MMTPVVAAALIVAVINLGIAVTLIWALWPWEHER